MDGTIRATIAREIVRLQAEYYGRGPTKAKVHFAEGVVVVVLEESFTPAEKTLIERGNAESIHDIRRRFQLAMADKFVAVVEEATGRKVRSFFSETDLDQDIAAEVFLLEERGVGEEVAG